MCRSGFCCILSSWRTCTTQIFTTLMASSSRPRATRRAPQYVCPHCKDHLRGLAACKGLPLATPALSTADTRCTVYNPSASTQGQRPWTCKHIPSTRAALWSFYCRQSKEHTDVEGPGNAVTSIQGGYFQCQQLHPFQGSLWLRVQASAVCRAAFSNNNNKGEAGRAATSLQIARWCFVTRRTSTILRI